MKRLLALVASLALVATSAFAHNPHAATKMGTVKSVQSNRLILTMSDGDQETVSLSPNTTYFHADDHAARAAELAAGMRVVVKMTKDGKTAASVKMSAPKKK